MNRSEAKCAIEPSNKLLQGAVRIGLEYIASIGEDDAKALAQERDRNGPFDDVVSLAQRRRSRRTASAA